MHRLVAGSLLALIVGCGGGVSPAPVPAPAVSAAPVPKPPRPEPKPVMPPAEAYARGWMPLRATNIPTFLAAHPTYDGRGVLLAILDSGIDPGIPGLGTTSTGEKKILDLRDFSGEGAIPLTPASAEGDVIRVGGQALAGVSRLRTLMVGERLWTGTLAELPLGEMPAADVNGDGDDADTLAIVVVRARDGWVLFADTDGDGSLANETPVHDYLVAREYFGWHGRGRFPGLNLAANFREEGGAPRLDLFFDTSAHGSHVAGIASGNGLYGVTGFNGVAPGAYLLGLKIANNANGGISTTGSMLAAMAYAIRVAAERRLPLVMNMSFGVGNEAEGRARIDALVDSVLAAHPEVVFAISAGNDGPGLSTMGFPGSASRALTVGATLPAVFLGGSGTGRDPIAYFSSRGGELAKPDIVTPGMAYSSVPRWSTGEERMGGTSMASPHAAGLAALLVSGLAQEKKPVVARSIRQALMVTAQPLAGETAVDVGPGQADVDAAWRWLATSRTVPEVQVTTAPGQSAGWLTRPLTARGDTALHYRLTTAPEAGSQPVTFRASAPWLIPPAAATLTTAGTDIRLALRADAFTRPGVYVGTASAWGRDTLAGPVARLVATVVVPDTGDLAIADLGALAGGTEARRFFAAQRDRPFAVGFTTSEQGEMLLAYLHEPGGQPYREDNGIGAGFGEQAGVYIVDARDVEPGLYEAVAVASPLEGARGTITIVQSPVTIGATRTAAGVEVRLGNQTGEAVETAPFAVVVGAERRETVEGGDGESRLRFRLPPWAIHATIDVRMPPEQWPAFTDFGVTMLDGAGRILGKSPMNYAFGRLHVDLTGMDRTASPEAELRLLPGFADPGGGRWTATVSIRLYADSASVRPLPGGPLTVPARQAATQVLPFSGPGLPAGPGFVPLAIVVVREADRTWTLEVPLPAPGTP
ncbi:MAG: S8 family serine peptidase [Gemmatimonadetes bacterium]|nr:S8 family serine peptidase [Gemmatimonadota bacterium]